MRGGVISKLKVLSSTAWLDLLLGTGGEIAGLDASVPIDNWLQLNMSERALYASFCALCDEPIKVELTKGLLDQTFSVSLAGASASASASASGGGARSLASASVVDLSLRACMKLVALRHPSVPSASSDVAVVAGCFHEDHKLLLYKAFCALLSRPILSDSVLEDRKSLCIDLINKVMALHTPRNLDRVTVFPSADADGDDYTKGNRAKKIYLDGGPVLSKNSDQLSLYRDLLQAFSNILGDAPQVSCGRVLFHVGGARLNQIWRRYQKVMAFFSVMRLSDITLLNTCRLF
jgi:hypothetical protein